MSEIGNHDLVSELPEGYCQSVRTTVNSSVSERSTCIVSAFGGGTPDVAEKKVKYNIYINIFITGNVYKCIICILII